MLVVDSLSTDMTSVVDSPGAERISVVDSLSSEIATDASRGFAWR